MKNIFLYLILIASSASVFAQNNIKSDINSSTKESERWNLDNYVWSHTHYKTQKNDKPVIDFNAINNWQGLGNNLSISRDGKYFAYTIERGVGLGFNNKKLDSLIVQSTTNSWRQSFASTKPGFFSGDSKQYIYQGKDTLWFLQVGGSQTRYVKGVTSYKLPGNNRNEWLVYQLKDGGTNIVLKNLATGKEKRFSEISGYSFDNSCQWLACQSKSKELLLYHLATGIEKRFLFVEGYLFAGSGKALLLKTMEKTDKATFTVLKYVRLPEGMLKNIWSASEDSNSISAYSMDNLGKQVVFAVQGKLDSDKDDLHNCNIWFYRSGMDKATLKVTNQTVGVDSSLQIHGSVSFTDNGHYIQFSLQSKPLFYKPDSDAVQLDVWNYKDLVLQSAQPYLLNRPQIYKAIIGVESSQVIPLEKEGETLYLLQGDFAIIKKHSNEIHGDRFWEKGYGYNEDSNWLVSLRDGNRRLLPTKGWNQTLWFSPGGTYLVYFDAGKGCHYFSYNLHTGKLADISTNVPDGQMGWIDRYLRTDKKPEQPLGIAAWLQNDEGLLVYDNYDIWQLDLTAKKTAINITNGYGNSHGISFSLINSQRFTGISPIVKGKESLLLRAFNFKNKYNGFYRIIVGAFGDPELLCMRQYFMNNISGCHDPDLSNEGMRPAKAEDVDTWIVQQQSANDAPNYYKTLNFKFFERLTNFQPQKEYNWLSEELHFFSHLDGSKGQGILYKPENFDSSQKYPVLIIFYGGYSNNLYQFHNPTYFSDAITPGTSPVWLLNQGYLIFTPDIYTAPLNNGPEAFNVIEGAVKYLKQLPYVDSNCLGCCAHSWSAKLGTFVFTHSKSFSATAISEGFLYANLINVTLSINENGISKLENVERDFQFGSLWENKNSWLDQTTVLNVDKANTPILLLCNKESSSEYQNQTLQLFTALRRLDKKAWWLKYEKGGHTLTDLNEMKDYMIRYTQYFDHYLKESPAPCWMTQGIPYALKGIEKRYELDPSGSCGKDCPICKKWNEQYKKHPKMFDKPIREWNLN